DQNETGEPVELRERPPRPARDPPADERQHRPDLERDDDEEERHLDPEETVAQVEIGRLLDVAERANEPGDEPERGGDAPQAVGGEQPVERARVGTGAQLAQEPAAHEYRAEPDSQGEHVQGREERRQDHPRTLTRPCPRWQRARSIQRPRRKWASCSVSSTW